MTWKLIFRFRLNFIKIAEQLKIDPVIDVHASFNSDTKTCHQDCINESTARASLISI